MWVLLLEKYFPECLYAQDEFLTFIFSYSRGLKMCRLSSMRLRNCVNFANFYKYTYLCMHACMCMYVCMCVSSLFAKSESNASALWFIIRIVFYSYFGKSSWDTNVWLLMTQEKWFILSENELKKKKKKSSYFIRYLRGQLDADKDILKSDIAFFLSPSTILVANFLLKVFRKQYKH